MPEFCSCGAQLPPDALFCHKCGKPQRDLVTPELEVNDLPAIQIEPVQPPRRAETVRDVVSFRNPVAMRIALLVAMTATVLSMTILPLLSWPLAGFCAVFFYRRRTGSILNVGAGARLGMITGVLMGAMFTIVVSLLWLPAAFTGQLSNIMQEQAKSFTRDPAAMQQLFHSMSGAQMAIGLLFSLAVFFLVITGLSMAGGALGAKLGGRQ
jgi:hypothetical protein